jgi:hypothetical protein
VQLGLVLDAQRCQVSVGREVTRHSQSLEQPEEDFGVPVAGMKDADVRLTEPGSHDGTHGLGRQGLRENLTVRGNPDEPEHVTQARPTGRVPLSRSSHQARAAACTRDSLL